MSVQTHRGLLGSDAARLVCRAVQRLQSSHGELSAEEEAALSRLRLRLQGSGSRPLSVRERLCLRDLILGGELCDPEAELGASLEEVLACLGDGPEVESEDCSRGGCSRGGCSRGVSSRSSPAPEEGSPSSKGSSKGSLVLGDESVADEAADDAVDADPQVQAALSHCEDWEAFDVFALASASGGRALELVTLHVLRRHGLVQRLGLDESKLRAFLRAAEAAYLPNPYHNSTHAADVVQAMGSMLRLDGWEQRLRDVERLALIVAAAVHDLGHPGVRNDFFQRMGAGPRLEEGASAAEKVGEEESAAELGTGQKRPRSACRRLADWGRESDARCVARLKAIFGDVEACARHLRESRAAGGTLVGSLGAAVGSLLGSFCTREREAEDAPAGEGGEKEEEEEEDDDEEEENGSFSNPSPDPSPTPSSNPKPRLAHLRVRVPPAPEEASLDAGAACASAASTQTQLAPGSQACSPGGVCPAGVAVAWVAEGLPRCQGGSVNERMHAAMALRLLDAPEHAFMAGLAPGRAAEVRQMVVDAVLRTDMAFHARAVEQCAQLAARGGSDCAAWTRGERGQVLALLLHLADISNPARPLARCVRWGAQLAEELFAQGDREAALGLERSPPCDRERASVPQGQAFFIAHVLQPTIASFQPLAPVWASAALPHVRTALAYWREELRLKGLPELQPGGAGGCPLLKRD